MDRALGERAIALYLPVCIAAAGWAMARTHKSPRGTTVRIFAAALLGFLWTFPALLLLQRLNLAAGWWSFPGNDGVRLLTMPLELWLGWAILWGVVPTFAMHRLGVVSSVVLLAMFDVVAMPLCHASLHLHASWLVGEGLALVLVLLPSLCLQRWTRRATHLPGRAALQVMAAGLVLLYLPAEVAFSLRVGIGWQAWFFWSEWQRQLLLQLLLVLAVPGLSAVQEFVQTGGGTPIPYDPPRRLVRSGIYRYVANPMQLSCTLVMVLWALFLHDAWLLVVPVIAILYSAGLAEWDEGADLRERFGEPWIAYRAEVRPWLPRWRPFVSEEATLYIARTCRPCSTVRLWLEHRAPAGLRLVDAETLPEGSIQRMRYCAGAESVDGVRAMGRALEHLHLGWAVVGAVLRFPVLWPCWQALLDACGLGPRVLLCEAKEGQAA